MVCCFVSSSPCSSARGSACHFRRREGQARKTTEGRPGRGRSPGCHYDILSSIVDCACVRVRMHSFLCEEAMLSEHRPCIFLSLSRVSCFFLTNAYLGQAMRENPGYLKLRRIRAAQHIARTVRSRRSDQ